MAGENRASATFHGSENRRMQSRPASDYPHYSYAWTDDLPFRPGQRIGSGAEGIVDEIWDISSNKSYVRKTWIKSKVSTSTIEAAEKRLLEEMKTLKRLRDGCHFIQPVSSYIRDREDLDDSTAKDNHGLRSAEFGLLHLPRGVCNLRHLLDMAPEQRRQIMTDACVQQAMGCLTAATHFMHQNDVRHKDIKPENILVHDGSLLFADFGLSRDFIGFTSTTQGPSVGTIPYFSPELAAGRKRGTKADVFALGCVFLEILNVLIERTYSNLIDVTQLSPYHANLPGVQRWAEIAKEAPDSITLQNFWLHACQRMLGRWPDKRVSASFVLQKLFEERDSKSTSTVCCHFCATKYTIALGLKDSDNIADAGALWDASEDILLGKRPISRPPSAKELAVKEVLSTAGQILRSLGLFTRWDILFYLENGGYVHSYGTKPAEHDREPSFVEHLVERVLFREGSYGHTVELYADYGRKEGLLWRSKGGEKIFDEPVRICSYKVISEGILRTFFGGRGNN